VLIFLNLAQPEITDDGGVRHRAVNFTFKGLIIIIVLTSAFSFLKTEARIRRCRHYRRIRYQLALRLLES
jgi:hypothetical protein